jgi:hypothetical protein
MWLFTVATVRDDVCAHSLLEHSTSGDNRRQRRGRIPPLVLQLHLRASADHGGEFIHGSLATLVDPSPECGRNAVHRDLCVWRPI